MWHDYDSDPSGGCGLPVTPWMIAGEPPQLMIRVFDHGVFVAEPEGQWQGTRGLEYHPGMQRYLARDEFAARGQETVAEMLKRRLRTLRYCRFCRHPTPPELRSRRTCAWAVRASGTASSTEARRVGLACSSLRPAAPIVPPTSSVTGADGR